MMMMLSLYQLPSSSPATNFFSPPQEGSLREARRRVMLEWDVRGRDAAIHALAQAAVASSTLSTASCRVIDGNTRVTRFMFVFSGPDISPEDFSQNSRPAVERMDMGQFSGELKYCIVSLAGSCLAVQLPSFVDRYNDERAIVDSIITLVPTVGLAGEPLPLLVPNISSLRNVPIWLKCEHDRKHRHPAVRVWINPQYGRLQPMYYAVRAASRTRRMAAGALG